MVFTVRLLSRLFRCSLPLFAGLLAVSAGYAENAGVTLSEVENKTLAKSFLVQKRIEGIGETKAKQDSLDWDYGLYLRSHYRDNIKNTIGTSDLPSDFRYRGDIDVEWELFRSGLFQNTAEKKSLEKMGEALQYDLKQVKVDELNTVRSFFFGALKQKSLGEGDRAALVFREQALKEIEALYSEKQILLSELMKERHEVQKLRSSEIGHVRDYRTFLDAIARRTGLPNEMVLVPPDGAPPSLTLERVKGGLGSNYQLASLNLRQQSVEAEPSTSTLWTLSAYGGYTFEETTDRVHRDGLHVGVRLSVPLSILGKAKAVRSEVDHRAKTYFFEYRAVEQDLNRQVDRLYFDYLSDLDLLKLEEQNLQVIDEDIRLLEAYVKNPIHSLKVSNLDLLRKRAERAGAQAQVDAKRYDLWVDYYKLYKFVEDVQ